MSLPVVSRKAGPSWLLGRRIPMRANLFLRSHTMVYTYCLLLLLAHRPDGSYYALWFLPRAAFCCLFAPSFAHVRSQRGAASRRYCHCHSSPPRDISMLCVRINYRHRPRKRDSGEARRPKRHIRLCTSHPSNAFNVEAGLLQQQCV